MKFMKIRLFYILFCIIISGLQGSSKDDALMQDDGCGRFYVPSIQNPYYEDKDPITQLRAARIGFQTFAGAVAMAAGMQNLGFDNGLLSPVNILAFSEICFSFSAICAGLLTRDRTDLLGQALNIYFNLVMLSSVSILFFDHQEAAPLERVAMFLSGSALLLSLVDSSRA